VAAEILLIAASLCGCTLLIAASLCGATKCHQCGAVAQIELHDLAIRTVQYVKTQSGIFVREWNFVWYAGLKIPLSPYHSEWNQSQQSWNQCGVVSLLSKDIQASDSQILFLLMTRFDNDSFSSVQSGTFLHAAWNYRVATRLCDFERICRVVAKTTQWLFSWSNSQHSIHS
jgi:hypothetical protein